MKTYLIDPAQRETLVRDLTIKLAVTLGIVLMVVILVTGLIVWQTPALNSTNNVLLMVAAIGGLALIVGYRMVGQVREYQRSLESLRIGITADRISRRQLHQPDLTIYRNEVALLQEADTGILVVAKDRTKYLWAPAQLQDYAEIRSTIAQWMEIHKAPSQQRGESTGILTLVWGVGTALCMGVLLFATDPRLVLVAGVATLAIYLFVYRLLSTQRGIDMRFRRTYSGVFIFLVVVVAAKLLMALGPLVSNH
jgi:hypothetical protein